MRIVAAINIGLYGLQRRHRAIKAELKAIHAMSGGLAGARTIAIIATSNKFELSRYRAAKLMVKLKLKSC